jgi:hypothetical protein
MHLRSRGVGLGRSGGAATELGTLLCAVGTGGDVRPPWVCRLVLCGDQLPARAESAEF